MANIQQVAFNAAAIGTVSPWIRMDWYEHPFNSTVAITGDTGGVGITLNLRYAFYDASKAMQRQVTISQATTVITVVDNGPPLGPGFGPGLGHGLAVNDLVTLDDIPTISGTYNVASVVSANSYTLTSVTSQTVAAHLGQGMGAETILAGATNEKLFGTIVTFPVAAPIVIPLNNPVWAIQLVVAAVTTPGVVRLTTLQGGK